MTAEHAGTDEPEKMPNLPLKIRLLLAAAGIANYLTVKSDDTINRRLSDFLDPKSPASKKPVDGVTSSDVTFDASNKLWFRLFTPTAAVADESASLPMVFYFHGGGFVFTSADSKPFENLCRQFAAQIPAVVISVNYRRSPEHRFPVPYEDCFDSLKYIDELLNFSSILPENTDLSRCFLAGDSAGGNIAHHVAIRASTYTFKRLNLAGIIAIQPFFCGEERTESELKYGDVPALTLARSDWFWKMFLPKGADRDHEAVNVTGPKAVDLREVKLPAILVVIGGYDLLQDAQRKYGDWLRRSGKEVVEVEIPSAYHGFYGYAAFTRVPEFDEFMQGVVDFVHKHSNFE